MSFPFKSFDYAALSLQDLLAARDLYHVHLMNKENVVATAVGYYRIRKKDKWPTPGDPNPDNSANKKEKRTLANSEVRPYSWPAILVFVQEWKPEAHLVGQNGSDVVPNTLFLPDGKAVPVCVIEAQKVSITDNAVDLAKVNFPRNVISGGFPLLTEVQNEVKIASFGCLVTDGHLTYALTNKHVTGKAGTPIKTLLKGKVTEVGASSELQLGRIPFEQIYPTLKGSSVFLNMDVGLVEIDDLNQWKAEVLGIGQLEKMIDLDTNNITLKLINQKVTGFGAVSGKLFQGEIQALFYRYKSVGGFEYVSDFLIGPPTVNIPYEEANADQALTVRYGDSGSLVLLEQEETDAKKKKVTKYYPLGLIWGMHELMDNGNEQAQPYVLATCLSSVCNLLDVELVRNWNLDLTNTWGEVGHFKIGAQACELVSNHKLSVLLKANQRNIGYEDQEMLDGDIVGGKFTRDFVPLTDVADIIWRTTRPDDESNHFCDIDETDPSVMNGKSLLQLSLANDANISLDVWFDFDKQMDAINPGKKPRRGALPFRVWQMYNQMISSLRQGKLAEFIVAGGTMSHYVGDACQPLHISYLHHGHPGKNEDKVHSDYETTLIGKKIAELFTGVSVLTPDLKVKPDELIDKNGKSAAKLILQLMDDVSKLLPPEEVVDCCVNNTGRGRWDAIWDQLGDRTIQNIASGSHTLAILWESAWKHGGGDDQFKMADLVEFDHDTLQKLYSNKQFVPPFVLGDPNYKTACF